MTPRAWSEYGTFLEVRDGLKQIIEACSDGGDIVLHVEYCGALRLLEVENVPHPLHCLLLVPVLQADPLPSTLGGLGGLVTLNLCVSQLTGECIPGPA